MSAGGAWPGAAAHTTTGPTTTSPFLPLLLSLLLGLRWTALGLWAVAAVGEAAVVVVVRGLVVVGLGAVGE